MVTINLAGSITGVQVGGHVSIRILNILQCRPMCCQRLTLMVSSREAC
jgi:hypothetical protein